MQELRLRKWLWLLPLTLGAFWTIPWLLATTTRTFKPEHLPGLFDAAIPGILLIGIALDRMKTSITFGSELIVNYATRRVVHPWSEVVFATFTQTKSDPSRRVGPEATPPGKYYVSIRLSDGDSFGFSTKSDHVADIWHVVQHRSAFNQPLALRFSELEASQGSPAKLKFRRLVSLVVAAVAAVLFVLNLPDLRAGFESRDWPEVSGSVSLFRPSWHTNSKRPSEITYSFTIHYEYVVDGRSYTGTQFGFDPYETQQRYEITELEKLYGEGNRVDVRYSPADPKTSVLQPGPSKDSIIFAILTGSGLLLGLLSCVLNMAWLRKSREAFDQARRAHIVATT